jgi:hypothetical protein
VANNKSLLTPIDNEASQGLMPPEMQQQALSQALQNRLEARANKKRLTPSNDADDDPGDVETEQGGT